MDNKNVTPEQTLSRIVANTKPGTKIPLDILREGKPTRLTATVGTRPTDEQIAQSNFNPDEEKDFEGETNDASAKYLRDTLGVSVVPLDPSIARRLGLPDTTRGLVIDIPGAGSAAQSGLQRVDIIVSANYKPVATIEELVAAIKQAKTSGRANILLGVKRRGGPTQYAAVGIED